MKSTLVLILFLLARPAFGQAGPVELNGLVGLADSKMAFLTLKPSGSEAPVVFTLTEGQSQNGVKLLHVDMTRRQVEIEQDGIKETITIAAMAKLTAVDASALSAAGNNPTNPVDSAVLAAYLNGNEAVERIKAGIPAVAFSGSGAASSSSNGSGKSSGAVVGASASTGNNTDHANETWYQESLNIEQARLASAQDVLAGNATPWPRTPLTPDNTPPQLIGKETYYGNHIPHFVAPGYTESLAGK